MLFSILIFISYVLQEVNFNMMDVGRDGLLKSVEQLILEIFIPALRITDYGWIGLGEHQQNDNIKKEFLTSLESFVSVLSGTQQSLLEKVIYSSSSLETS